VELHLLKNTVHITHAYPSKQKTAEPNNRKTQKKELKKGSTAPSGSKTHIQEEPYSYLRSRKYEESKGEESKSEESKRRIKAKNQSEESKRKIKKP